MPLFARSNIYDQVGMPIRPGRACVDGVDAAVAQPIKYSKDHPAPTCSMARPGMSQDVENGVLIVGTSKRGGEGRRHSPMGANPDRGRGRQDRVMREDSSSRTATV